jgi:hypothetical protein
MISRELKRRIDGWVTREYEWLAGEIEKNVCKGKMKDYAPDLTSLLIESLYKLPDEKITQMLDDDKVGHYLLVGAGMQLRSSTSPFYQIFRKHKSYAREDGQPGVHSFSIFERPWEEYDDSLYECFQEAMEELHWYERNLITKYFLDEWTLQEMYEYYGISKKHIIKDINNGLQAIREHCKDC